MPTLEKTPRPIVVRTRENDDPEGRILLDLTVEAIGVGDACRKAIALADINCEHPDPDGYILDVLFVTDPDTGEWKVDAFRYNPENPPEIEA